MNRILKHIVLPSGLHALQTKQDGSDIIRTEIFTEEEYQHFTNQYLENYRTDLVAMSSLEKTSKKPFGMLKDLRQMSLPTDKVTTASTSRVGTTMNV